MRARNKNSGYHYENRAAVIACGGKLFLASDLRNITDREASAASKLNRRLFTYH